MNVRLGTQPVSVMVVGIGPHSLRTHLPWLRNSPLAQPTVFVELASGKAEAERAAAQGFDSPIEIVVTQPFAGDVIPAALRAELDDAVRRHSVGAVIIATEPTAHYPYLRWAIETGLHALVDKPIVIFPGASSSPEVADRVGSSVRRLIAESAARPSQLIAVGTQRRYHPAFVLATELLTDAAMRFGTAVTSMSSSHADGQFRYPHELESISYHGFGDGNGKVSHSGYHSIAVQADIIQATTAAAGMPAFDEMSSYAAAVRPAGYLQQIPRSAFENRFGVEVWAEASGDWDPVGSAVRMRNFGEIDVFATNTFKRAGQPALLSQIALSHTSVSRRSALRLSGDLYKGSGRLKHERHDFTVGPFLNVQIHSFQSRANHDGFQAAVEGGAGGNNHMEVLVFRNSDWWPSPIPEYERFTATDLAGRAGMAQGNMFTGHAKERMLDDFFLCVSGRRHVSGHASRLQSHRLGADMFSTILESLASGTVATQALGVAAEWAESAVAA